MMEQQQNSRPKQGAPLRQPFASLARKLGSGLVGLANFIADPIM